jgi:hypothetical protein
LEGLIHRYWGAQAINSFHGKAFFVIGGGAGKLKDYEAVVKVIERVMEGAPL